MPWKIKALEMSKAGYSWRNISRVLSVPKSTVSDFLRERKGGIVREDPTQDGIPASVGVLLLDIETAPAKGWFFDMFNTNINVDFVEEAPYVLSFSCKWLGNDAMCVRGLPDYGSYVADRKDDGEIIKELNDIIYAADVVVAHNLLGFDYKVFNARAVYNNLAPLDPKMCVDTYQIAKKEFKFPSNSLAYLSWYFGFGAKQEHSGARLWRRVVDGDMDAWKTMLEYNAQDVALLEKLYLKLRPWDRGHPNVSLLLPNDKPRCVTCGSGELLETGKHSYTKIGEYVNWECLNCGKVSRSRRNVKTKEDRENILTNAR